MNSKGNSSGKTEPFSWSKLSKQLEDREAKPKRPGNSWAERSHRRQEDSFSSSSDTDLDSRVTSRQRELLQSSPSLRGRNEPLEKTKDSKFDVLEGRGWLKSARQRELVRAGSDSNLSGHPKEQSCGSALQRLWPSTARRREKADVCRGDWCGSAGSGDALLRDSNRDSAGSFTKNEDVGELLVEAVRFGRTRHIKLLLDGGTDPNTPDHEGVTPLIAAVADVTDLRLRQKLMQVLLESGADPNVGDRNGTTPLMHATSCNSHEAAVTLLQHEKTDPGLQNNDGLSALMLAATQGSSTILLLILAAFKKVQHLTYLGQKNCQGLTALDLAEKNGHFDICNLLRADAPTALRPQGPSQFLPAADTLSRSPTPTDSFEFSPFDSDDVGEPFFKFPQDQTFRPTTPVTGLDASGVATPSESFDVTGVVQNVELLSLDYDTDLNHSPFVNSPRYSSPGSGNEADTESLMEADHPSVNESDRDFTPRTVIPYSMSATAIKSANSSIGIPASTSSVVNNSPPQVKILGNTGKLLVDRNAMERLKDISYSVHASSSSRKESFSNSQSLNPLIKIPTSPTKRIPVMVNADAMPKLSFMTSSKSLNKSIKDLVQDDYDIKPGNRPPTPVRPSLPTLLKGKHSDPHGDGSLSSSSSTEATIRIRRMTIAGFPRSTSEPKTLSVPPPQRSSQDEDEHNKDILDVSTKSEGWDVLWGARGRSSLLHTEGHVVPLPPIGHKTMPFKSMEAKHGAGMSTEKNVLSVAKKTLERLETVLSDTSKHHRKSKSHSRPSDNNHLDTSS